MHPLIFEIEGNTSDFFGSLLQNVTDIKLSNKLTVLFHIMEYCRQNNEKCLAFSVYVQI